MSDLIAYEARELNRDPRCGFLINSVYNNPAYLTWNGSVIAMTERIYTIYCMERISLDMYNVLDRALKACYNVYE